MSNLEITKERIYDELKDLTNDEIVIIIKSLIQKLLDNYKIRITVNINAI